MHRIKFLKIIIILFALLFALSLEYQVAWVDQPHYVLSAGVFNFYPANNGEPIYNVPKDVHAAYIHSFGFGGTASVTVNFSSLNQYKNNLSVESYMFILGGNGNLTETHNSGQIVIRINGLQSFETYNLNLTPGFYSVWFFTEISGGNTTLENITNHYNTTLKFAVSEASVSLPQPTLLTYSIYLMIISEAITILSLQLFGKKSYLDDAFLKNSKK